MISRELLEKIGAQTTRIKQNNEEVASRRARRQSLIKDATSLWKRIDPPQIVSQIAKSASRGSTHFDREDLMPTTDLDGNQLSYSRSAEVSNLPLPDGMLPEITEKTVDGTVRVKLDGIIRVSVVVTDEGTRVLIAGGDNPAINIDPQSQKFSEDFQAALETAWDNRVRKVYPPPTVD